MRLPVDTSGHIVYEHNTGRDITYYWIDEYGNENVVPINRIVPPGMCERCFANGDWTPAKVVHHIIHLSPENIDDPHVALSYDNFQRLCQDCHAAVHTDSGEMRVTFDESGRVVWKER